MKKIELTDNEISYLLQTLENEINWCKEGIEDLELEDWYYKDEEDKKDQYNMFKEIIKTHKEIKKKIKNGKRRIKKSN